MLFTLTVLSGKQALTAISHPTSQDQNKKVKNSLSYIKNVYRSLSLCIYEHSMKTEMSIFENDTVGGFCPFYLEELIDRKEREQKGRQEDEWKEGEREALIYETITH